MASNESGSEEEKQQLDERIAALDSVVMFSFKERRRLKTEIGRALIKEKALLGHGRFERHVKEKFGSLFSFRTAERLMERAKAADTKANSDNVSELKSASDEGARSIREAYEKDKAEVELAVGHSNEQKGSKPVYRLPLRMTDGEVKSMEALRKLPHWHKAERKIVHFLRKLFVKYDVAIADGRSH